MRRVTVVVPFLVSPQEAESALRSLPAALQHIVEHGSVVKLSPISASATPEAAFLALDPEQVQIAQGPLTVAALGHRPPEGSVHFHLTLATVDEDGVLREVPKETLETPDGHRSQARMEPRPPGGQDEVAEVLDEAKRLATKTLTPLLGELLDHALVWEDGWLDLQTTPPGEANGQALFGRLPRGEGEVALRQFIDDSVNLLSSLELNRVRREEGLPPLNCLWPWGQGLRPTLPSLPLRRGDVLHVVSGSMRMQGLCGLVGYVHGDRRRFGTGLRTDFEYVCENAAEHRLSLAVVQSVEDMQRHHRTDETVWTMGELSKSLLEPLLQGDEPFEFRLAAPGGACSVGVPPERASNTGLGLSFSSVERRPNHVPFDERSLEDPRVPTSRVWQFLSGGFVGEA